MREQNLSDDEGVKGGGELLFCSTFSNHRHDNDHVKGRRDPTYYQNDNVLKWQLGRWGVHSSCEQEAKLKTIKPPTGKMAHSVNSLTRKGASRNSVNLRIPIDCGGKTGFPRDLKEQVMVGFIKLAHLTQRWRESYLERGVWAWGRRQWR